MMSRIRDTFDFGWKFFKGDARGAQQPNFADASWREVDLPHDWSIEGPINEKPPMAVGGGQIFPMGIGWYRKHFNIPESYRGRKVFIEFEGVYQLSEVWINGQYLGKRPYGFIGFCYDMTPHLKYGGDNVIAVKADNSHQPNCRWYQGSGIYRHTWLLVTGQVHGAYWGTFVTTPKVEMDVATVQVKTRVQNEGNSAAECRVTSTILDRDGNPAEGAQPSESMTIPANGEYEFVQQIRVDQPKLWSTDNPYLYQVRTSVMNPDMPVDSYDTVFGIRRVEFDVDRGFLLNGKQVKLKGLWAHEDAGCMGNAVPERVWERKLEILKGSGCNSIRTAHNPYAPVFLDLCDRLGFLVMDEVFDEWKRNKTAFGYGDYFDEWSERDVTDFVRRDRNHPSVVMYSAGNEISEQNQVEGVAAVKRLVGFFHREDPTRPVTMGCDRIGEALSGGIDTPPEFLAVLDIAGYNYFDRRNKRAETYATDDRHAYRERRFVGTENTGPGGPTRGDYSDLVPPGPGVAVARRGNRGTDFEQLWRFSRINDWVIGDHYGHTFDHMGESQWPAKQGGGGIIDTCGFVKDGYYLCQSLWTDKPMVHLLPHWNWKGHEGRVIPVLCYTNCDSVELFVNGESYGVEGYWFPRIGRGGPVARQNVPRTTSDLHLTWTVPYQPGTLKAVGTKDGKVAATFEVSTTGEPAAIELSVDRDTIAADRRDLAHFTVRILDAQGRLVPTAGNKIDFDMQGEGKIIGVDGGDPVSHEDCKGKSIKAFNGLCLAIVQSTAKAGRIQMTASSPGLKPSSLAVTTKA
jgi:beta-galactosidase